MFFSYFYYSADGEGIVFLCLSSVSLVCDVHLSAPMSASLFNLTRQWSLNAIIADFPSPSSYRKNFDSFSKLFTLRRRGFSHIGALDGTVPVRGRDREHTGPVSRISYSLQTMNGDFFFKDIVFLFMNSSLVEPR